MHSKVSQRGDVTSVQIYRIYVEISCGVLEQHSLRGQSNSFLCRLVPRNMTHIQKIVLFCQAQPRPRAIYHYLVYSFSYSMVLSPSLPSAKLIKSSLIKHKWDICRPILTKVQILIIFLVLTNIWSKWAILDIFCHNITQFQPQSI